MEVIAVLTSESSPEPVTVSVEAMSLQCPPRVPSLVMVVWPLIAAATVAGVVVLAGLTSWWVLFALFALPPVLMMVCGSVMMTAMPRTAVTASPLRMAWTEAEIRGRTAPRGQAETRRPPAAAHEQLPPAGTGS